VKWECYNDLNFLYRARVHKKRNRLTIRKPSRIASKSNY
jgi:hypothetical protein